MLDKAISGSKSYYLLLAVLGGIAGAGTLAYLFIQLPTGLGVTGLSRDVTWGVYIGQFTFLVGVAASGLMVVLPYYLHDYHAFGKITILGEFLAIGAVVMCMTFVFVDMGMPSRVMNVPLYPTPNSVMFWDFLVLFIYLGLNVVIGLPMLMAERAQKEPPYYILKPLIYLSIAWAPLIHTVTAFLYSGMPGRHHWLTAIMAVRFLAGAFAAGPSLLIILYTVLRRFTSFDDNGEQPYRKLGQIILYAMIVNMFCLGLEFFTAYYSKVPGHMDPLDYLYFGHGGGAMVPVMWASMLLGLGCIFALLIPALRNSPRVLPLICAVLFLSALLEKGYGLIVGGFTPNPLGDIVAYSPTGVELLIAAGVYAIGLIVITVLYKMVVSVREEAAR
jgi:Ni/Fe-hydrogenase subunit HybB-like protein